MLLSILDHGQSMDDFEWCTGRITPVFQHSAKNKSIMGRQSRRPSGFIAVPSVLWRFHGNLDCVSRPGPLLVVVVVAVVVVDVQPLNPSLPLSLSTASFRRREYTVIVTSFEANFDRGGMMKRGNNCVIQTKDGYGYAPPPPQLSTCTIIP